MSGQVSSWGSDPSEDQSYLVKARCIYLNRDLVLVTENKELHHPGTSVLSNQGLCDFVWLVNDFTKSYPTH